MRYNFSKNPKFNGVLNEITEQIQTNLSKKELLRYRTEFKYEPDYNIAQYGNLLIYYTDIEELYKRHGYKTIPKWSNNRMWELYKRQVGYIANFLQFLNEWKNEE